ncbi:MAG: four helix bundle protein [Candidatus Zambryskibacteria bacterium RIFCSPLOWO2_01_FULL_47_33]|nr:MAG: four helix bundle protein [Candidatus Zambryskibacteria bacterium RIFCSPLOWO2_01_FULL_47_33]
MINSHKDLIVWQKGIKLCKVIYEVTEKFPKAEIYGITSQMRRSAVSIPSNIAEGRSRNTTKDFLHFLSIALGSASELETQLEIAKELSFLSEHKYIEINRLLAEVSKMTVGLMKKLESKS